MILAVASSENETRNLLVRITENPWIKLASETTGPRAQTVDKGVILGSIRSHLGTKGCGAGMAVAAGASHLYFSLVTNGTLL